jgi:LmbE family N-acetylglucosaminyl deacetylase
MRILVVMAHPDDPEFAAGGTIARWTQEGHEVIYCWPPGATKAVRIPR